MDVRRSEKISGAASAVCLYFYGAALYAVLNWQKSEKREKEPPRRVEGGLTSFQVANKLGSGASDVSSSALRTTHQTTRERFTFVK